MKISNELKLYMVEFGKPLTNNWYQVGGSENIYVIAKSYEEAFIKATEYATVKNELSVIEKDGSIKLYDDLTIKCIKLACVEFVY